MHVSVLAWYLAVLSYSLSQNDVHNIYTVLYNIIAYNAF